MSAGEVSQPDATLPYELIATAASGTEAIVKRELAELGYEAKTTTPGRLLFRGDDIDLPHEHVVAGGRADSDSGWVVSGGRL